ncbi:MAG TPA: hypothetical protein VNI84_17755 [Pyrinomonadaceae bacterium]|nr:hypothetical protein [Pyrinomonadaceae bacterium]
MPVSFQVGLSDHLELFFNTDAYRAIKVNSPNNLSSFALNNSSVLVNGRRTTGGAIVLAPRGAGTSQFANFAVFRPVGTTPFVQFPFVGGNLGNFGFDPRTGITAGGVFGFGAGNAATGSVVDGGGNGADSFPGIGSVFGSILPGVVLQTATVGTTAQTQVPTSFTLAPSYLPDAPFINRTYGESAFNTFTVGAKIRFTGPNNPYGIGLIPFYRFYADQADDSSGFNQLQRGSSPGGGGINPFKNRGDVGLVAFGDARLRKYINLSGNIGYIYNSSVKADFPNGEFTLLDRPDELLAGIGIDFPVNRFFQPIAEFRSTTYVGGRTPNAFENNPMDALAGVRVYPARYISLGAAYRYHVNQQDADSFGDNTFSTRATVANSTISRTSSFSGVPPGFQTSSDPHGFIFQFTAGRRNARQGPIVNQFANVTNLELGETTVTTPCPVGQVRAEGAVCSDDMTVTVRTTAVDPENDVLTYNYTVSGGRIVGQGANVDWDLTGAAPGTYTITAGVDDSCGVCGQTQTRTITVANCNCITPPVIETCVCPTVTVTGPSDVTTPGGTLTFTANISGESPTSTTYDWSVTQGEIISGQGTPVITVQSSSAMAGQNIVASVRIGGGNLCATCGATSQETAAIQGLPESVLFTTIGVAPNDEVRGILDNYFVELQNNPTDQGYIIVSGPARAATARERLIRNHIRFRNFDASRITIVRGTETPEVETRLYRVPAGAENPQ